MIRWTTTRRTGICADCGAVIERDRPAGWEPGRRRLTCEPCTRGLMPPRTTEKEPDHESR